MCVGGGGEGVAIRGWGVESRKCDKIFNTKSLIVLEICIVKAKMCYCTAVDEVPRVI